jgi:hypothetical protein
MSERLSFSAELTSAARVWDITKNIRHLASWMLPDYDQDDTVAYAGRDQYGAIHGGEVSLVPVVDGGNIQHRVMYQETHGLEQHTFVLMGEGDVRYWPPYGEAMVQGGDEAVSYVADRLALLETTLLDHPQFITSRRGLHLATDGQGVSC